MLEMFFCIDGDLLYTPKEGIDEILKIAKDDGYITTKTVSDILKPESVSDDFIISDLTWWSYDEIINNRIQTFGEPIVRPGYVMIRFPQYHTGPFGAQNNESKQEELSQYDVISHPSHYTEGRKYEPRKVISDWRLNFNLGNAVKYLARAGRKGDKIEDLRKAIQYIEFEIEDLEGMKHE